MRFLIGLILMLLPHCVCAEGVTRGPPFIAVSYPAHHDSNLISVLIVNPTGQSQQGDTFLVIQSIAPDGATQISEVSIPVDAYLEVEARAMELTRDITMSAETCDGYGYARISMLSSDFTRDFFRDRYCPDADFDAVFLELSALMRGLEAPQ